MMKQEAIGSSSNHGCFVNVVSKVQWMWREGLQGADVSNKSIDINKVRCLMKQFIMYDQIKTKMQIVEDNINEIASLINDLPNISLLADS